MPLYIRADGLSPGCTNAGATWEEQDIYGPNTQAQVTPQTGLTNQYFIFPPKCVRVEKHPSNQAWPQVSPLPHTLIYNTAVSDSVLRDLMSSVFPHTLLAIQVPTVGCSLLFGTPCVFGGQLRLVPPWRNGSPCFCPL